MKERPILFSGPMVRAILAGEKTQTRRVVNPDRFYGFATDDPRIARHCPYGVPGDRLWVRETWGYRGCCVTWDEQNRMCRETYVQYRADGERHTFPHGAGHLATVDGTQDPPNIPHPRPRHEDEDDWDYHSYLSDWWKSWRPSTFLPRWASRILLEITDVRAERLQAITEEDAWAEGIERWLEETGGAFITDRRAYAALWDQINAERGHSWESNPWVWVISFRRVEP